MSSTVTRASRGSGSSDILPKYARFIGEGRSGEIRYILILLCLGIRMRCRCVFGAGLVNRTSGITMTNCAASHWWSVD